jgi:ABC-type branched-subunit amino acid transport system substrate-binding protein
MFASDTGSVDPTFPINTGLATFFKAHGGTVLGTYGYGVSVSSSRAASGTATAAKKVRIKAGVVDTSIPFGGVAFTTEALAAKSAGDNTLYGTMDDDSNFALLTAMQQAGVKFKVVEFPTGSQPIWKSLQGAFFSAEFRPFSIPDAGTKVMATALQKYAHRAPSEFPTYNIYEGWTGADLMIKGIQLAGTNPTPAAIIKDLRQVKNYSAHGIPPTTSTTRRSSATTRRSRAAGTWKRRRMVSFRPRRHPFAPPTSRIRVRRSRRSLSS